MVVRKTIMNAVEMITTVEVVMVMRMVFVLMVLMVGRQ